LVEMRIIQTSVDVVVKSIKHELHPSDKFIYERIINFVICDSCYWSASWLKLDRSLVTCPGCGDDLFEFMPLTETEANTFDREDKQRIIPGISNSCNKAEESLLS
jgi:hypothetical protein